ncbi:uncharacterized protein LOC105845127 isoform X2 [Hydra vulgaris]
MQHFLANRKKVEDNFCYVNYPVQDNQELEVESEEVIRSQEASLLKEQQLNDFKKDLEIQHHLADENGGKIFCNESLNKGSCSVIPCINELLFDEKWKSVINELSMNDKERFYKKLSSPIKCFCKGFSSLSKNLDQGERLYDIVNYFQLPENDRIMVLLANYGGGNPAMSVFEDLKHSKPYLAVKDLCNCLETLGLNHALEFLESLKLSDEVKVSNINKSDLTNFSYKLISFNANVKPWKDVAHELCNSKEDVNRIVKTMMHPNQYSPTEMLIEILSMRTSATIQDFLMALKSCNNYDAYELMCQNIILEIQNLKS